MIRPVTLEARSRACWRRAVYRIYQEVCDRWPRRAAGALSGQRICVVKKALRLDGLHQRHDPEDLHRSFQVIGQHVQAHLGAHIG